MQIIVPMSGFGERFRRAGYTVPKPLIEVDGRPIIQYVVDMYPGETDFVFICNSEHLATPQYAMAETLGRIAPKGRIVSIAPHKLGPVHAVLEARAHLAATGPVIVNYCELTCDWDYEDFKRFVAQTQAEGCIPCYRGFHPHTLWSNYYAYVRENQLRAFDIQEKQPFTESPRNEFASSGTYYFASRDLLLTYAKPHGRAGSPGRRRILCQPDLQTDVRRWPQRHGLRASSFHAMGNSRGPARISVLVERVSQIDRPPTAGRPKRDGDVADGGARIALCGSRLHGGETAHPGLRPSDGPASAERPAERAAADVRGDETTSRD